MPRNKWPDTFGMGGRMIPEYAGGFEGGDGVVGEGGRESVDLGEGLVEGG